MEFLKLFAVLCTIILFSRLLRTLDNDVVRIFPGHYKIRKITQEDKTLYYTLFVYKRTWLFFDSYCPVGSNISHEDTAMYSLNDCDPDGESHFVEYKFNSVKDAETYWENNFLKNN